LTGRLDVKPNSRKIIDIARWQNPPVKDPEEAYRTSRNGLDILNTLERKHPGIRIALKSMAGMGLPLSSPKAYNSGKSLH
jgi:hypothetical protein